jgi:hypothetical protein
MFLRPGYGRIRERARTQGNIRRLVEQTQLEARHACGGINHTRPPSTIGIGHVFRARGICTPHAIAMQVA